MSEAIPTAGARQLPAREIPIPQSVSAEGQMVLGLASPELPPWPRDLSDVAAVEAVLAQREMPAEMNGLIASGIFGTAASGVAASVTHIQDGALSLYEAIPEGLQEGDDRLYIVIHGAWIFGGGDVSAQGAEQTAGALGIRTWALDYRMPPQHPYPAALDDAVAAYRMALETRDAGRIVIGGTSGGGNIALAAILRARDEGLPLPGAAIINTPFADMLRRGDTMTANIDLDGGGSAFELDVVQELYLRAHDRTDPYVSPLEGDFTLGFPPTILTSGTRDFLLSDTVRVHRALRQAGVDAELHVWEAGPHTLFMGMAPEDRERNGEYRRFLESRLG